MEKHEIDAILLKRPMEPYLPRYDETKYIISQGGQILLPYGVGDAPITFGSRWALAELLDELIQEALLDH